MKVSWEMTKAAGGGNFSWGLNLLKSMGKDVKIPYFCNRNCFLKLILIQIDFLQFLPCIQIYLGIINNQGYRGRLSIHGEK